MRETENRGLDSRTTLAPGALILALVAGTAAAPAAWAQDPMPRPEPPAPVTLYNFAPGAAQGAELPQEIRIMQRIVRTALAEVEPPELPEILRSEAERGPDGTRVIGLGGGEPTIFALAGSNRAFRIGGQDVTGFYMQGYGYLFTVRWRVGPRGFGSGLTAERMAELNMLAEEARRAATRAQADEARAADEAERALEERRAALEEQRVAWEAWSAEYRSLLALALREVVAVYGSTLKRAQPEESVTFMADFGGEDDETVTVSARRGDLTGVDRDRNLDAVRMSMGEATISPTLRTELKIMAEIIDSSLQIVGEDEAWAYSGELVRHFGGDSAYQYVPGYGVLFRKSARLNLATRVVQRASPSRSGGVSVVTPSFRQTIEETTEEQLEAYAEHLDDLERKTAEILATYGPTLTELGGESWVGIYYNVGSAASLLEGGISNFLVQARMADIREAASQADSTAWLLERIVTNEKQD